MPRTRGAYPPEFKARMVELVRAGRSPESLAKEFEPSANAIRNWAQQADRDEGRRSDGLTTAEREELRRLRRELKQVKLEREILAKATARPTLRVGAPLGRPARSHPGVRVRERSPGSVPCAHDVPRAGSLP